MVVASDLKSEGYWFESGIGQQFSFYGAEFSKCFMLTEVAKIIGAGLATISLIGAGVGIGQVFGSFLLAIARNPSLIRTLFTYTILGFALVEAIALFGLMMAFLILFGL